MRKFALHFVGGTEYELFETLFVHPLVGEERRCIRGKRSGAYRGCATFQWTKAVQGLALLALEAGIRAGGPSMEPLLAGRRGSFASSLDYAIDKQTTWLMEMFGWDTSGTGVGRRLFPRSNPGQRFPGPVAISLNLNYLSHTEIQILVNERTVTDPDGLRALRRALSVESCSTDEALLPRRSSNSTRNFVLAG
jgi:hypothetical protein